MKFLVELLAKKQLTLASCESLTGGLFATKITEISGASQVFKGGYVVYSNEAKIKLINISSLTLEKYGAISEQCAGEMAQHTQKLVGADLVISFTGNAGPSSQENKPVGLVFIGLITSNSFLVKRYTFQGSRKTIRRQAIKEGIKLIKDNFRYMI